jgi:hypothetical protein
MHGGKYTRPNCDIEVCRYGLRPFPHPGNGSRHKDWSRELTESDILFVAPPICWSVACDNMIGRERHICSPPNALVRVTTAAHFNVIDNNLVLFRNPHNSSRHEKQITLRFEYFTILKKSANDPSPHDHSALPGGLPPVSRAHSRRRLSFSCC